MFYTKIFDAFWIDQDIRSLDDGCKLLYLYLLTCRHRNMLGFYELPVGYIADDLRWGSETVSKRLEKLSETGFIRYDFDARCVLIPKFLEYNPLDNENQVKGASKNLKSMPETALFLDFSNCLETLPKRYQTLIETVEQTVCQSSNRNRNQNSNRKPEEECAQDAPTTPTPRRKKQELYESVLAWNVGEPLKQAMRSFIDVRVQIKPPMTLNALELSMKKVMELSGGSERTAQAIIEQSVMNGWKGLFPLKDGTDDRKISGRPREPESTLQIPKW